MAPARTSGPPATPDTLPRRSFLYRHLSAAGAVFSEYGDATVAARFPGVDEAARAARLGIADLSPLPRWGVKGPAAPDWLAGQGVVVPAAANLARTDSTGGLVARLSAHEHLLLWPGNDGEATLVRLEAAAGTEEHGLYVLPRRDSHAWLCLVGTAVPACLAKLCAVDLRPAAFADLAVAQTQLARIAVVLIRQDRPGGPTWHLLWDSASAAFLWQALSAAAAEFDGGPIGLDALEAVGGM